VLWTLEECHWRAFERVGRAHERGKSARGVGAMLCCLSTEASSHTADAVCGDASIRLIVRYAIQRKRSLVRGNFLSVVVETPRCCATARADGRRPC